MTAPEMEIQQEIERTAAGAVVIGSVLIRRRRRKA